jgi:hypothetical protein
VGFAASADKYEQKKPIDKFKFPEVPIAGPHVLLDRAGTLLLKCTMQANF